MFSSVSHISIGISADRRIGDMVERRGGVK